MGLIDVAFMINERSEANCKGKMLKFFLEKIGKNQKKSEKIGKNQKKIKKIK